MTRTLFSLPVLLWLSAFICALYFNNAWQLELFGASVALVFLWSIALLQKGLKQGWQVPQSWAHRFMAAFWLLTFCSLFVSVVIQVSLMAFCFFSVMPLSFYLFTLRDDHKSMIAMIGYVLAVIFAVLSVWALIQFFFFNVENRGAAHHPLANSNSLGALLNLAILSAIGWVIVANSVSEKWIATAMAILYFGGLIATSSRGAFFSLALCLPVLAICLKTEFFNHGRYLITIVVGSIALFFSSTLGDVETARIITRTVETVTLEKPDISNNRFNIWEGALAILKDNWLFGIGMGMFFLYYNEYRIPEEVKGVYHAHSDPLQFWVEMGVLGPVLFYALLIAVLIRTVKAYKAAPIDGHDRALLIIPFFALGAVTMHAHVTFNFYNLSILYGCGFLLAVWYLASEKILGKSRKEVLMPEKVNNSSGLVLICMPFLMLAGLFLPYLVSEHLVDKARKELIAGDLDGFSKSLQLSHRFSQYSNYRTHLLGVTVPLSLLEHAKDQMDEERLKDVVDQAVYYLNNAGSVNPRSAAVAYYKGNLRQLAPVRFLPENFKTSEEYYRDALKLSVLHLGARMAVADILMARGDKESALAILEEGYRYHYRKSTVIDYYEKIALAYLRAGQFEKHTEAIERAQGARRRFGATAADLSENPMITN